MRDPFATFNMTGVVIGSSARQTVVIVNVAESIKPLFAPPGIAESSAERVPSAAS